MARPKTGGRQKGTPNKITAAVREAILGSLPALDAYLAKHRRWPHGYLVWLGIHDTRAYGALLGKALPSEVKLEHEATVTIRDYTGRSDGAQEGGGTETEAGP